MTRLTVRDLAATVLVVAILVPYVGYRWQGDVPFIEDPRGMAATALILGVVAFLIARRPAATERLGRIEAGLTAGCVAVGAAALIAAETAAAEALLATFIVTIVVVWAVQMLDHTGYLRTGTPGPTARR